MLLAQDACLEDLWCCLLHKKDFMHLVVLDFCRFISIGGMESQLTAHNGGKLLDMLGTFPTLQARMSTMEHRTLKRLDLDIGELRTELMEIQRRLGETWAFTIKGRRAMAPDEERGLASQEAASASATAAATEHVNVHARVHAIEEQLNRMRMADPTADLSRHTIETEYDQTSPLPTAVPSMGIQRRVQELETHAGCCYKDRGVPYGSGARRSDYLIQDRSTGTNGSIPHSA